MIHILLMILKVIGTILLVIAGLLLAAVLLLLFVPVRYRADLSYDQKPDGEASLTWLLHTVRLKVSFHEHADACGWILWFKLFDIRLWPEETEESETDAMIPEEKETETAVETSGGYAQDAEIAAERSLEEPVAEEKTHENPEDLGAEEPEEELTVHATEVSSGEMEQPDSLPAKQEPDHKVSQVPASSAPETASDGKMDEKRSGISSRFEAIWRKLRGKLRSAVSRIRKFPEKLRKWIAGYSKKKQSLEKTWNAVSMFWHDERNRNAFRLVWKRTKKLIRYVLPKRLSGRIHFGFEDPYDTGQVLAAVSPFYGLYAKTLTLEPDFTGTALDGELHLKGRIAVWYPLWTAARLFFDKDFRRLLKFLRKRTNRAESE